MDGMGNGQQRTELKGLTDHEPSATFCPLRPNQKGVLSGSSLRTKSFVAPSVIFASSAPWSLQETAGGGVGGGG